MPFACRVMTINKLFIAMAMIRIGGQRRMHTESTVRWNTVQTLNNHQPRVMQLQ